MPIFSIPVMRLPSSFVLETPSVLPVVHQGEHVADARLRDGSYYITLFMGELEQGLTTGGLLLKARFVDEEPPGQLNRRTYVAIEIIPKLQAELMGYLPQSLGTQRL